MVLRGWQLDNVSYLVNAQGHNDECTNNLIIFRLKFESVQKVKKYKTNSMTDAVNQNNYELRIQNEKQKCRSMVDFPSFHKTRMNSIICNAIPINWVFRSEYIKLL